MRRWVRRFLRAARGPARSQERRLGPDGLPVDFEEDTREIIRNALPYTMTSPERLYALVQAVRYIQARGVAGALVECGVWKGGSMMAVADTLRRARDASRDLYLFDTFEGMPPAGSGDLRYDGVSATALMDAQNRQTSRAWAYSSVGDVRRNLRLVDYPEDRIHCIVGRVEDTIPDNAPREIALLRLDTDWYESTAHELKHLFPRLVDGGVLIIDDYGHWQGARRAVTEYFGDQPVLLHRIDYTGRLLVKSAVR